MVMENAAACLSLSGFCTFLCVARLEQPDDILLLDFRLSNLTELICLQTDLRYRVC